MTDDLEYYRQQLAMYDTAVDSLRADIARLEEQLDATEGERAEFLDNAPDEIVTERMQALFRRLFGRDPAPSSMEG